jgi:hypothetical protein
MCYTNEHQDYKHATYAQGKMKIVLHTYVSILNKITSTNV